MSNISKDDILRKIVEKTEEITGKELPDNIITYSDIPANTTYASIERFNSVMKLAGYLNDNIYDVSDKEYIECMIYNTIVLILKHHKARMDYQLLSCIYTALCEIGAVINRIVSCDDVAELLNYVLWITYAAYCVGKGIQNEATEVCFEVDYDIAEISIRISDIDNVASIQDIICRLDEYFMDIEYYNITDKKYFDKLYKSNDQLRHNDVDNVENVINERESNMIRKEEFSRRRTPDVYTRRNGKLEKLNEKKPYGELVERMDDVIDRLDTIIEGMENFISGIYTEISFDIDDLLLPEKMREHIKRVNKEQSGDTEEDDEDRPDIDSVIGILEMLENRDSDSIIDPYNKIDIRERYIKIEELLNEIWFGKTTQESDDTSDDNTESEDEYDDSNEIPSCNIILKDDIIKKIKERTEEFTKKKIPSNIIDNLETNDHIVRFTSVMGDFLNGLIDNTDFETNIEYIKLKIYYSMLVMLQHYTSKIDYKTLSRLYNTLNRIFDVINSTMTNELKLSILIDYTLWITFIVHCLSDGLLDIPAEMRFSTDNKNKLITIYVSKNDIIKDVYKIINDYSSYHKSIRFGIERKSLFDGYTVLNPSEFKLKKTIFCILGESGSGKDTLVNYLINDFKLPLKSVLSYTDRPIRPGEQQGKEHIFLSKDKMTALLDSYKKDIAAYTKIGETGYRYCATTTTINKSDIYIIDPNGLKDLKERTGDRYNIVSIYIDCPLEERRKRAQKRGDEAIRFESRVNAESEQFAEFREEHGYDYIIDNGPISTIYKSSMALLDIFRYYKKDIIKK